jgi:hypothetical protein
MRFSFLRADPVFAMTIPGKVQSYLQAGIPVVAMLDGEGARVIEARAGFDMCAGRRRRVGSGSPDSGGPRRRSRRRWASGALAMRRVSSTGMS